MRANDPFRQWESSFHTPRRRYTTAAPGIILAALVVVFGLACLNGWLLMLAVGIASSHSVVGGTLPFWDSVVLAFLVTVLFATSANMRAGKD